MNILDVICKMNAKENENKFVHIKTLHEYIKKN